MIKLAALVVIILIIGGGVWYFTTQQTKTTTQSSGSKIKQINISGSSSGLTLLTPIIFAFEKKYPDIKIKILPGTETSDGIKGVGEGMLDIGSAARPLKKEEQEKYPNITGLSYAKDAMVLGVNPSVTVKDLTKDQVIKIHSGAVTDWSKIGGEKGKITVLDREESESSKAILRKFILGADLKITKEAIVMHSGDSMNKAIVETPGSIGQTSLGVIKMQNLKINPLAIGGIVPNINTIKSGAYEMVREYGIAIPKGQLKKEVSDFVDFLFSSEAQNILAGYEIVPVPRQ